MVEDDGSPTRPERSSPDDTIPRTDPAAAAGTPRSQSDTQPLDRQAAGARPPLPERIGTYRIVRMIGEGGMGTVYEAEQENPKRTVALKVIRAGLASDKLLRRFEHEAHVLGRLQHPGIAQVFEADTAETPGGHLPFFAMELIRGRTLRDHARQGDLSVEQRLALIASICDAVHHAHQKGVIHRDLKPGNILVDSSGQSKILDFGVARATDSDVQLATMQTDVGQLVGTVQYMSPEQAAADPDDLDTRSDVYALGVILYELLADKLPYEISRRNLHEAVRVIREQDPTSLSSISKTFRGDIETIVAKALEKDKDRRYESAEQLAADIRHHLNDEPIVARPASTLYQLRKFAKRNRSLVSGVIAVFAALTLGLIVSVVQYREAESERRAAEEARRESDTVTNFLANMLRSVNPGAVGLAIDASLRERVAGHGSRETGEPHSFDAALASLNLTDVAQQLLHDEILGPAGATVDDELGDQPLTAARLHHALGAVYYDIGLFEPSEAHHRRAAALYAQERGADDPDAVHNFADIATIYRKSDRFEEAEELLTEIWETRRRTLGDEHPETLGAKIELGDTYRYQERHEEAEKILTSALADARQFLGDGHYHTLMAMNNLALTLSDQGRDEEAVPMFSETIERLAESRGPQDWDTLNTSMNLASTLSQLERYEEAVSLARRVVDTWRRKLGNDHWTTLLAMSDLAVILEEQGELDGAASLFREVFEGKRRLNGPEHQGTIAARADLVRVQQSLGRPAGE